MKTLFKLILVLALAAGGLYWFAGYTPGGSSTPTQHTAQTTKEQTIEQGEDQLSRGGHEQTGATRASRSQRRH